MCQIISAQKKHLNLMIPLLYETSCFEYTCSDNKLHLPISEFCKKYILMHELPYASVLVDNDNPSKKDNFAGFSVLLTKEQLESLEEKEKSTYCLYRDDPILVALFEQLEHSLKSCLTDKDIYLFLVAIAPAYRNRSLFREILDHSRTLAKKFQKERIVLLVWESNPARKVFEHYGMRQLGIIDFSFLPKPDKLVQGYFAVT